MTKNMKERLKDTERGVRSSNGYLIVVQKGNERENGTEATVWEDNNWKFSRIDKIYQAKYSYAEHQRQRENSKSIQKKDKLPWKEWCTPFSIPTMEARRQWNDFCDEVADSQES